MIADLLVASTSLIAQAADASNGQQAPGWTQIVPFIFIIGFFYFILIRPQMKAKKEQETLISSIKTGDKVITSSGILGNIANVKDKTVIVKIADNVKIELLKSHVTTVIKDDAPAS
jgi:preprotein translocase subunit YajC